MKEITLTQGKFALVDDEDYKLLNKFNWYARKSGNTFYAIRSIGYKKNYMHRLILGLTDNKIHVDHIDRNGLNNQRGNLRQASQSKNICNKTPAGTSKYLGVHWRKDKNKWEAQIRKTGVHRHLGLFKVEVDAAKAYDNAAKVIHGEFANLNFKESAQ